MIPEDTQKLKMLKMEHKILSRVIRENKGIGWETAKYNTAAEAQW